MPKSFKYKCPDCNVVSNNKRKMNEHITTKHKKIKLEKKRERKSCPMPNCDFSSATGGLSYHIKSRHENSKYFQKPEVRNETHSCIICGPKKKPILIKNYKRHLMECHGIKEKVWATFFAAKFDEATILKTKETHK